MTKHILLSIKTNFVQKIIAGTKIYEYRKVIPDFSDKQISKTIIIYSSAKDKAIVGEFEIEKVISMDIETLITETNIPDDEEKFFKEYFDNKAICHAIKIKKFKKYEKNLTLKELKTIDQNFVAPQNYRFLDDNNLIYKKILKITNKQ